MAKQQYDASQITVLEGLEPVRKRPGMYIGSTDSRGLHECLREIIDNSVDESFAGTATEVWVQIKKDGSAEVRDNGRGIPTDLHKSGVSALELTMTKLHAGGKFGGGAYKVSGGLHGVGASVVNALSSYFRVCVLRDKKVFYQEYKRGVPLKKVSEASESQLKEWGIDIKIQKSGTITAFMPDTEIFKDLVFEKAKIKNLLRDRAYLVAKLAFNLKDYRDGDEASYYFEGGIKSLVAHSNRGKNVLSDAIYISKDDGNINCEVAIQYTDGFNENVKGFVNGIYTTDGGTHVTGFRTALTRSITDYVKKNQNGKDETLLTGDDLKEGLTAVVYVKMPSETLQFESQTKAKLNNPEVQGFVAVCVKEGLDQYFEEHPQDVKKIIEKVTLAAKARLAARAAKDAVLRKGALDGASLPGKLADCQSKDASISEIYIVEGDSAGGCWVGDTKVALVDGRNLSFVELIKEVESGIQNYCYTMQKNGHIGVAPILNPRLTKHNAKIIKITLDNEEVLKCTPDHLFMLRDATYKKAEELTSDIPLMAFDHEHLLTESKIKEITKLDIETDVYDLEVPETHNFALASGIFVHNSAKQGRDRKFQAILPLKGKILNTERARLDTIVKFEGIKNLIIALGVGIGETINYDKIRYHRVIIMTDADVDGEHIKTLLLTFFYRHMPEIITRGYLYVALPPLYKITVGKESTYVFNDEDKDTLMKKIGDKKFTIARYKGLGEMNAQQLWETTMDPATRTLKQITIDSIEEASNMFEMLMGEEVPPRKKFIQTHAKMATLDV